MSSGREVGGLAWRVIGASSLSGSGVFFLIGTWLLVQQEGAGSSPVEVQLATARGRASFTECTAALAVAVTLAAIGSVPLHVRLRQRSREASALAAMLTALTASFLLAVLALRYALSFVAARAVVPSDRGLARAQQNAFTSLIVFSHGAGDLGGFVSFGLLAAATALTCAMLIRDGAWRLPAVVGLLAAAVLPILYAVGASYVFIVPFALWEILLGGYHLSARAVLTDTS